MPSHACAACGAANPSGALYCGSCGAQLGSECPSCGALGAPGRAFCTSCGALLQAAPSSRAEERKIVSFLFADLVGFTGRAEQLDPEEVHSLLSPYHARLRAELERYGGTVEKFIGDAVVALFGAPVTHEDDAERAVRAALAVREAMSELNDADPSPALQLRVGITTGEALVNRKARPLEGEGMAAGDVVNTAARLQAAAPADGILVDEATYHATKDEIEYREATPVSAKGKARLVPAWEVLAPRARTGVDVAFRGAVALVGRDDELSALRDAFARVRRERAPQLATLVGVPGIGKSRLVYELSAHVDADPTLIAFWRQGRSLPYGDGVSFWALGELTKAHAGILESDEVGAAEEKLRAAVTLAVSDPTEAQWVEGHLRPLVGLGGEAGGAERRGEAFAAWRRFFEAIAEERPLILVFEDIHWADEGLLDFIDHLVEWTTDVPLFVLCTARPELLERRPGWGGGKRNAATISLTPLSHDDTARLVTALTGEDAPALVAKAGGNPLYAEEYARMLSQRENGGELPLPDSVQGIIAARLDTLPLDEKTLVQDAAVLGKTFWAGELEHVADAAEPAVHERLRALERKEFIRRERRSSVAGETAYVFRHVLVRDVAYGQMPRARRADKHRRAAEWIEALAGDRREDLADMVAHHYSSALELTRATGGQTEELAERARLALREAGDRAAALFALDAAERFYSAALALWPEDEPERPDLLLRYGRVLQPQGRGKEALAQAAEELLDSGDREAAAEATTLLGDVLWLRGEAAAASEHFEGAVSLLSDGPPSRAKAFALAELARSRMMGDEADRAVEVGSQALDMAEALGLDELRASALNTLGVCRVMTGDLDGLKDLERAIEISREIRSFQLTRALNNMASTLLALGEIERAHVFHTEAAEVAKHVGWKAAVLWLEAEELDWSYYRGQWDEALAQADAILAAADADSRHVPREMDARVIRALLRLARDDAHGADEDSAAALSYTNRFVDPQILFPALATRARVLFELGAKEEAESLLRDLLDRWGSNPFTPASDWLSYCATTIAGLGRGREARAVAQAASVKTRWLEASIALFDDNAAEAARIYAQIGAQPEEAHARLLAAERLLRSGRRGEAEAELSQALEFYRRVDAARMIREAEALLAPT